MRPTEFSTDTIVALLRNQTIASLPEVTAALGPGASRRTAFRKLKDLAARNSYSHRGGFYTLDELVDFDELGLWSFAGVRFSRLGTLIATAESFVNHAEAGHFVDELDNLLQVGTQDALRKLVGDGRLSRHKLAGQFLYCAVDRTHQTHQLRARRLLMATPGLVHPLPDADLPEESCAPRSCCSPACSTSGNGGCSPASNRSSAGGAGTGASPDCSASTRRRLPPAGGNWSSAMSRSTGCDAPAAGGGRRKKTPEVIDRIQALMAHETAGDPRSGLKWTRRASESQRAIRAHHRTARALPRRQRPGHQHRYQEEGTGRRVPQSRRQVGHHPELVNDHDFRSDAEGLAIPYGIYDTRANAGTVFVGQTADTPAFAVDCIENRPMPSVQPQAPRPGRRRQRAGDFRCSARGRPAEPTR